MLTRAEASHLLITASWVEQHFVERCRFCKAERDVDPNVGIVHHNGCEFAEAAKQYRLWVGSAVD